MTFGSVQSNPVEAGVPAGILRLLPPPPARILLIGARLESSTAALSARGYALTQVPSVSIGSFPAEPGFAPESMHAIIVGELPAEMDALTLFSGSYDVLAMSGVLILLAPAARHASIAARRGVAPADYLTMVAERHGFSAVSESVDTGLCAYTKSASPRWRARRMQEKDVAPVLALFRDVFGHPLSLDHWQWKYGEGRGSAVAARRDGEIVAHYGGVTRPILLFGEPARAFQICDVMVDLKERSVFTKSGPFYLCAASFAESAVTAQSPFGFGFPNARVMRLAEKTGLYADVGGMTEVRWLPLPDRPRLLTRARHLRPDESDTDRTIDRLWEKMALDLRDSVVGVRDSRYIRHRYFEHPDKHYDVVAVTSRLTGSALGIIVLRREAGRCELLDVVAPLKSLPVLFDQARRLLSHWGLGELHGWITQQHSDLFTATGGQQHALDIRIPTSNWIDGPELDELREKWWLMGGDTDFR